MKIKESEKINKYFEEHLKYVKHVGDGDSNCSLFSWNVPQRIGTVRDRMKNRDHSDDSIAEIGQNT